MKAADDPRAGLSRALAFSIGALMTVSTAGADPALSVDPLFSNHMVLQRAQPITIRGLATPSQQVSVSIDNASASSVAGADGNWAVELPAMPAGGPHKIVVTSGDERVSIGDVLIGDVWVCSGQSNMDFRLEKSQRADEYVPNADVPGLRLLQIERAWDREPLDTVETRGWRTVTPDTARRFTAVGYHFGRILNEKTGVPIGLIHSCWGGTPAEAWTPMPELEARPDVFAARLESLSSFDLSDEQVAELMAEADRVHADYAEKALMLDEGVAEGWMADDYGDDSWELTKAGGYIQELNSFDGVLWLRRTFELPESAAGRAGELYLGRIDDYDEAWVNGVKVGSTLLDQGDGRTITRDYAIPAGVLRAGLNTVAVRLLDVRSGGGFMRYNDQIEARVGDVVVPLAGTWSFRIGFSAEGNGEKFPRPAAYTIDAGRPFRRPAVLYNAMIHPLADLRIAGVIWYQGESNAGRADELREMMPSLIQGWRKNWGGPSGEEQADFPFYFVQLPNFRDRSPVPTNTSWAEIRQAQLDTLKLAPNTGMAVTIDVGDPADIHPTDKLPVGERLARLALHDYYGESSVTPSGPLPGGARAVEPGVVVVHLDYADGLKTTDGRAPVGFAVAGADGEFVWADAEIRDGAVVLRSDTVSKPVTVRYAWDDNPAVNLVNADDLPASPFQLAVEPAN